MLTYGITEIQSKPSLIKSMTVGEIVDRRAHKTLGFFIAAKYISWNTALNTDLVSNTELLKIVVIVFFFFCIGFVLKIISSVLQAMQKYAINDIIALIAQFLGLIAIFILVNTTDGSLFYLCLVYGSKYTIVMSFASLILFNTTLKNYRPSFKHINIRKALPLLNLGLKFFLNQILYLILTQSTLILVVQFFGPGDVTVFNLAVRYVTITSMVYIMILTPFLSAFTEAFTKNDLVWIKTTIKRINYIWLLISLLTVILVLISDLFFKLWVGDAVTIPISLVIALAISNIINTWGSTYTLFLNGIGKIQLQIYILVIQAILFLPLSYMFFKMGFGLIAIVAAQGIFYFSSAIVFTVQYRKIISKTATGIWAR